MHKGSVTGHGRPEKGERRLDLKPLKRLFCYMAPHKLRLLCVGVCILVSAVTSAASMLFLRSLIDGHIVPLLSSPVPDFSGLLSTLFKMAALFFAGVLSVYLCNRLMVTVSQKAMKAIRDDLFAKMQRLPVRYFDTHTHGETMSLYTNDIDTLRQLLSQSMVQVGLSFCTIVATFISMLSVSIYLTLAVIAAMALIFKAIKLVAGRSGRYFMEQQHALADLNGYVEEIINGQKVVKVFCHENAVADEMRKRNGVWADAARQAGSYANTMMPMMNALGNLQYVFLAVAGAFMAIHQVPNLSLKGTGTMTLGMIAAFLTLSRNFTGTTAQVSNQFNFIVTALAGASRIFAFMDEAPEEDEGQVSLVNVREENGVLAEAKERTGVWAWKHPQKGGSAALTRLAGHVTMENVYFGYVPEKTVLKDITLYAEPGQKVAFVGATGAGKTTITNLLNRFYDIDRGTIRYDGIDIGEIQKTALRRSLGMVLQDVHLFTGTVMENLRYGNLDATDEECIAAAKLANADGFIRMLPKGYDTLLTGDGSGLSQGQRQLISIARAAVSDPPVMILDEATSSVDTRTEKLIQDGMDKLMKGRTVFVIAHRLSTVRNADVIMVLENGSIIERGSHQKLLDDKGTYYRLYTGAFELE